MTEQVYHTLPEVYDFSNGSSNTYKIEPRHQLIPPCYHCHRFVPVILDGSDYFRYFVKNADNVQAVFHYLLPAERELLITGTHPECWDDMMGPEDEGDDE